MPEYFYPKNHRKHFCIATPAARAPHSTRGSLPAPCAKILAVIFWSKSIRAGGHCHPDAASSLRPVRRLAPSLKQSTRLFLDARPYFDFF